MMESADASLAPPCAPFGNAIAGASLATSCGSDCLSNTGDFCFHIIRGIQFSIC